MPSFRFLAALATALAVVGASAVPAGAAGSHDLDRLSRAGAEPTMRVSSKDAAARSTIVRHVKVEWKGAPGKNKMRRTVPIPGIGKVTLVCQPNLTIVSLEAYHRDRETQMWMAKYQDKSYGQSVAVKTVRIYKHATAADTSKGGTSNPEHEGLNMSSGKNGVENYSKGYAYGIISQRAARNRHVGNAKPKAATTFDLNWYWNGMDYPPKYRYCKIDATFETKTQHTIGINWHGDKDAKGHEFQQVVIPSVGYLQLRCETGRFGRQIVGLVPDSKKMTAYVEIIQGEGRVDQQVTTRNLVVDKSTGRIGPIEIPRNGMMRFYFKNGNKAIPYLLSSYQVTNNKQHPFLNVCETAMGAFPR